MKSIIDASVMLDSDNWVVSLVRKPKGKNPEHAILIVEGIEETVDGPNFHLRRYDFVVAKISQSPSIFETVGQHDGLIISKERHMPYESEDERVISFWAIIMKDLQQEQECRGISWNISPEQAAVLQDNINTDKANPPDYQISGKNALLPISSSMSGHNCYTWARKQLLALDNDTISQDYRLDVKFRDFFASRTSVHVSFSIDENSDDPTSGNCLTM